MSYNTTTEYVFDEQMSIYIQHMFPSISVDTIRTTFKPLGNVGRVDFKSYDSGRDGKPYKSAFIHFDFWRDNVNSRKLQKDLNEGKETTINYDGKWYWKLLPCIDPLKVKLRKLEARMEKYNEKEMDELKIANEEVNMHLKNLTLELVNETHQRQEAEMLNDMLRDELNIANLRIMAYEEDEKMREKIQNARLGLGLICNPLDEFEEGQCYSDIDEEEFGELYEDLGEDTEDCEPIIKIDNLPCLVYSRS
jgi:hypothetical protein